MKNRLLEMAAQLEQLRSPGWSYTPRHGKPRQPAPTRGNGSARKTGNGATPARPAEARAFGYHRMPISAMLSRSIHYTVPGHVPALAQASSMSCWATVATMMLSWRDNASYSVPEAIARIGTKWKTIYDDNTGLAGSDKAAFLAAAGLTAEAPANYTVEHWETLLREYGPLWVTTNEGFGSPFSAVHARVITGISGDGTPSGTTLSVIDPAGGRTYDETFQTFVNKYEDDVRNVSTPRIQIVHWARGARR